MPEIPPIQIDVADVVAYIKMNHVEVFIEALRAVETMNRELQQGLLVTQDET